jgi:hypothetical protein
MSRVLAGDVFVKGNLAIGSKGMEVLNEQRFSFKVSRESDSRRQPCPCPDHLLESL